MSAVEILVREEPITKPPTRWRNKFRVIDAAGARCSKCLNGFDYGETFLECSVWPSRDVAETEGPAECFDGESGEQTCIYLGAFPVEGS